MPGGDERAALRQDGAQASLDRGQNLVAERLAEQLLEGREVVDADRQQRLRPGVLR